MVAQRSGDGTICFEVRGDGPALLVPSCNYDWWVLPHFASLTDRFRVVTVSPRGFQGSESWSTQEPTLDAVLGDLLEVCDELAIDRFGIFGYSLSAALGASLACRTDRVRAAVFGGFPLQGDYAIVHSRAVRDAAQIPAEAPFDVATVLAVYRDLAALEPGALVDGLRVPLFAFWGGADDLLRSFGVDPADEHTLGERGATVHVVPGIDHDGVLGSLDRVLPVATRWLDAAIAQG